VRRFEALPLSVVSELTGHVFGALHITPPLSVRGWDTLLQTLFQFPGCKGLARFFSVRKT